MKKSIVLFLFILIGIWSCEGPQGVPGPQGTSGPQGTALLSQTTEHKVNFTQSNNYQVLIPFASKIYDSDVVLVYILWEVDNGTPIWRLLPQVNVFSNGELTYNADFTVNEVRLFLESNLNINTLEDKWRLDQTFRIVVVPAEFANRLSKASYREAVEALNINESDFIKK